MRKQQIATALVNRLKTAGFTAYFAGGWVRDFLMKQPSDDIDIATSASVAQIQGLFPKTIPVGVAFGIVIVAEEGERFEVATFRKDRGYHDGRRPLGIDPATPEEDAQRRDFTINGMFYDPLENKLFDFVGGEQDLKNKVIRAIGDPHERFLEDRLRMMRAVRYSTRFNFPIEPKTLEAILAHASSLLPSVAMERIWQEFKKMSQFAHFDKGLESLYRLQLLQTIFPLLKEVPLEEIQRRVSVIERLPKTAPTIAELLELFPSLDLDQLLRLCDALKLSRQERDFVQFYHHALGFFNMPLDWQENLELIEWAHFYAHPHAEVCLEIARAHLSGEEKDNFWDSHQKRKLRLQPAIVRIRSQNPIISADHLMQEGILPGKKLGDLLKEAERIAINQELEDREKIMLILKETKRWNSL